MEIQRYDATLVDDMCGNKDVLMRERHDGLFVRHEDHLAALAAQQEEIDRLKGQLSRIIETNTNRSAQLRGHSAWHSVVSLDRPDLLAWREGRDGRFDLLMYNNALGDPIYVAETTNVDALLAENAKLQARLDAMRARYAFHENQRLCVGDAGACDGDLEGTEHEEYCPARILDMTLRPHLYDDAVSLNGHWQPLPSPPKEQP